MLLWIEVPIRVVQRILESNVEGTVFWAVGHPHTIEEIKLFDLAVGCGLVLVPHAPKEPTDVRERVEDDNHVPSARSPVARPAKREEFVAWDQKLPS